MNDTPDHKSDNQVVPRVTPYWHGGHILLSLGLILGSLYVIYESIRFSLPLLDREEAQLSDMPGLSPIICSVLLIILSTIVILKSRSSDGGLGYFFSREFLRNLSGSEGKIVLIVFGSMTLYVFLLFPYLPYPIATMIFLGLITALLKAINWRSVMVHVVTVATLWLVFGKLFHINLPH